MKKLQIFKVTLVRGEEMLETNVVDTTLEDATNTAQALFYGFESIAVEERAA